MADAVTELDGVGLRDERGREILRDVTVSIAPASLNVLTGPSGAGKSTLLRLMSLTLKPTGGRVRLFGIGSAGVSSRQLIGLRRRIGLVFDDLRLLDRLTAYENVALPLRVRERPDASFRAEVTEILAWVGSRASLDERVEDLPESEKQLIAIARALVTGPDLVLADDPMSRLDDAQSVRFFRIVDGLRRQGTAIVIATPKPPAVDRLDARRLALADGRLADAF